MSFDNLNKAIFVINRFKWIDQKTLLIVNEDGIEKLIDIDNNFKEIGFNYRPLFNEINGNEYEDC